MEDQDRRNKNDLVGLSKVDDKTANNDKNGKDGSKVTDGKDFHKGDHRIETGQEMKQILKHLESLTQKVESMSQESNMMKKQWEYMRWQSAQWLYPQQQGQIQKQ